MVNMNLLLEKAKKNKYVVPQFNVLNLEWIKIILEAAQECNKPVILAVSDSVIKDMGGYNVIYSLVVSLIHDLNITIPICLHLDQVKDIESCKKAINAGFTSVMIDISKDNLEKNIETIKNIIDYAHKFDISIEAKIDYIDSCDNNTTNKIAYATVDDYIKLVEEINIDVLLIPIGNVNKVANDNTILNLDIIEKISNSTNIPLALYSTTETIEKDIQKFINYNISKITINIELQIAWNNAIKEFINNNLNVHNSRKIISVGELSIKKVIREKYNIFKTLN